MKKSLKNLIAGLNNLVTGLSNQERRLVMIMGGVFGVIVIFLVVFFVKVGISDLEDEGESFDDAIALIDKEEANYLETKERTRVASGLGRVKPTPLRTLVDKIAKQMSLTAPDVKELPEQRSGKSWIERSVELSLRSIGLISLTRFMEEVKGHGKKFPIAITKLEIRNVRRKQDTYNVKMVVSTYEQLAEAKGLDRGSPTDARRRNQQ